MTGKIVSINMNTHNGQQAPAKSFSAQCIIGRRMKIAPRKMLTWAIGPFS